MSVAAPPRLRTPALAGVLVLSAAALAVGNGFARFSYAFVLPGMVDDVLGSYAVAGWLAAANLAGYLVGIVLVSVFSSRFQPVQLLRLGLALAVAGMAVLAVAPTTPLLALGMVVAGFGSAGVWVPLTAIVASVAGAERRGAAMGTLVAGVGVGLIVAGRISAAVRDGDADGWRYVWAIQAAIGLAVLAFVLVWRPAAMADAPTSAGRIRPSVLRSVPGWLPLTVSYTLIGIGYIVFASYLVAVLEDEAGFSSDRAALVYSLFGATSLVGGIACGVISDRVGRRAALVGTNALLAVAVLLVLTRSDPWVSVAAALGGLLVTGLGAIVPAYVGDHLAGSAVSAAFAAMTVPFGAVQAVAPWAAGALTDAAGSFTPSFLLAAGALAASAVVAALLPGDRRTATPVAQLEAYR